MVRRRLRFVLPAVAVLLFAMSWLLPACGDGGGRGSGGTASRSPSASPVVVTVNGVPATAADLAAVRRVSGLTTGEEFGRDEALRLLVAHLLIAGEARRLGIEVEQGEIDERMAELRKSAGGRQQFEARLKSAGVTQEQLRATAEAGLLAEKVQDARFSDLVPSDAEVRRYYEANPGLFRSAAAVDLGDIAMRTERIAASVRERILAGQSFATAAAQFNIDPELRAQRGRLGWVSVSSLPDAARRAIGDLEVGELSPVVQAPPHWHVFMLFGRRPARVTPFAEAADGIRAMLTRRERSAALSSWVEEARAAAAIETK